MCLYTPSHGWFTRNIYPNGTHPRERERIEDYLAGRPLAKLPKVLEEQKAAEEAEAEDLADEV
jgi:hypothetical protein